ncbi:jg3596, partial [Pararge aegeria aegeria]
KESYKQVRLRTSSNSLAITFFKNGLEKKTLVWLEAWAVASYHPTDKDVPLSDLLLKWQWAGQILRIKDGRWGPKHLSSSYHLYADDLQLYTAAPPNDIHVAINNLNRDLDKINTWSESYGLSLNPNKSQVAILGGPKQVGKIVPSNLPPIRLGPTVLAISSTVKNLGIHIDCSLTWGPHIAVVGRKLFATIGCLRRWKNFLPIKTKISLAHSLLLPILDYADSSYPDLSDEHLKKQNLCIRFIFGLRKFDHVSEYRARLKWLPIRLRRNLHLLSFLYYVLYNPHAPSYLKERFSS